MVEYESFFCDLRIDDGAAIFLLGLRLMSRALRGAAGTRLKWLLERFVQSPLEGAVFGAVTTAAVQSSSAVAATVVALVNSGVFTLEQAFAVILGANVGTTVTAQLIAFDLGQLAPFLMAGGLAACFLAAPGSWEALFGFGALLFGLSLINKALLPWLDSRVVKHALTALSARPWQAVLVGAGYRCGSIQQRGHKSWWL